MNIKHLFAAGIVTILASVLSAAEIITFYPLGKVGIFLTGETPEFQIKLKDKAPSVSGTITVRNSDNKVIKTLKMTLPTGKLNKIKVDKPAKNGFFVVEADFGGARAIASMVITPKTEKPDPFFIIQPFHWTNKDTFTGVLRLGFGGFKLNVGGYRPYKENFNPEELRKEMRKSPYYIRVKELMDERPDLYYIGSIGFDAYTGRHHLAPAIIKKRRDAGYFCYPKEYYDCFIMKIEEFHRVAKGRIKCWIMGQEIDSAIHDPKRISFGGPVELAHHLISAKLTYNTLKRLDPDCRIGLMSSSGKDYHFTKPPFLLTRFILSHLEGKFDFIALDPYNGNYSLKGGRPQIEPPENGLRRHLLDSKILCREFGKDGTVTVEERQKMVPEAEKKTPINGKIMKQIAAIEARDMIIIKSVKDIPHYSYLDYAFRTDQTLWRVVFDEKKTWLRTPFPAAMSVATTIRTLSFAKPVRKPEIILPYSVHAYLFQKDGKTLLPIWHADTKGGTVLYEINLPSKAIMRDLDGNDYPLHAGKRVLKLTNAPIFLFFSEKAATVRKMVESGRFANMQKIKGAVRPASNGKANILLVNPLNTPQSVKVSGMTLQLKGAEKKVFTIPMPNSDTLSVAIGKEKYELPVSREIIKIKQKGTKIRIAAPGNVYPRSASIPERNLLLFDGKDIAADIVFSWNNNNLIIDAKVHERSQKNTFRGAYLWRGDSMQLGIAPADQAWSPELVGKKSIPFNMSAALTEGGPSVYDYMKRQSQSWRCNITRSGLYTNYHLEIPWSAINIGKVHKGKAFAMNILFFEMLRPDSKYAEFCISLTEGLSGGQNAYKYKTFVLE